LSTTVAISIFGECATKVDPTSRWGIFSTQLRVFNIEIVSINSPIIDQYISIDHSKKNLKLVRNKVKRQNRFLILRESRSVMPDQFKLRVIKKYKYIFSCAKSFDNKLATHYYQDGFLSSIRYENYSQSRPIKTICVINENKFSLHKSANYSFRQHAIGQVIKSDFEITVAGKNWDQGYVHYAIQQLKGITFLAKNLLLFDFRKLRKPFRKIESKQCNLVGFVDDKISFMNGFRYALIIENDNYRPTEKIFDALTAGCIPIYFGPIFSEDEIPSNIYIRIESPKRFAETIKILSVALESDYTSMRDRGHAWISSVETYERWSEIQLTDGLSSRINDLITD